MTLTTYIEDGGVHLDKLVNFLDYSYVPYTLVEEGYCVVTTKAPSVVIDGVLWGKVAVYGYGSHGLHLTAHTTFMSYAGPMPIYSKTELLPEHQLFLVIAQRFGMQDNIRTEAFLCERKHFDRLMKKLKRKGPKAQWKDIVAMALWERLL